MGTGNGFLSIDEPTAAIDFEGGGSNIIKGNNLANNYNAMSFLETENNTITKNNITNTLNPSIGDGTGIAFWGASNNTIYHNNFINNTVQAYDNSFNSPFSVNVWDNGYPSGGNYWSDYQTRYPNAKMRDSSGIGNASYIIDQNNTDHYPLLQLFNITSITESATPSPAPTVPEVSIIAILPLFLFMLSIAVVFKHRKTNNPNSTPFPKSFI